MKENVRIVVLGHKDHIGSTKLIGLLREVEKISGEEAQVSDSLCDQQESLITVIWPGSIKLTRITEETSDIFGWYDKVHLDQDGKFWFTFKPFHGLSTEKWLNEEDADTWIQGMMAAEELDNDSVHETEIESFKQHVREAKALA